MWITQFFSLISLLLVTTYALPTRNLDDNIQNAVISISTDENSTQDRGVGNPEIRHPVVQNKPRILVSYGNVYKQTPADPMQNLLMYFLMNVARDFAQDQDQFEKRRSPNFFSDAKATITDVSGKIINGSRKVGQKVSDTYKAISSREAQPQYEEPHYYPHIDGTCMCFNRLIRHGSIEMKNDRVKDVEEVKDNIELSTEKRSRDVTDGQLRTDKTTELKTENHNVPDTKEKSTSTIAVAGNNEVIKRNNTMVRVIKVMDLDRLENSKATVKTTTAPKSDMGPKVGEDLNMELRAIVQDDTKIIPAQETCKPPMTSNTQLMKKETANINKNRSNEDDGYYFLLVSGGTDKRTTAPELKAREHITLHHYENLLPKYEDKLPHLRKAKKRRRRRRVKRHHHQPRMISPLGPEKHDKKKLEVWEDEFRRQATKRKRTDDFFLFDDKFIANEPNLVRSDSSALVLSNAFQSENEKLRLRADDVEPPTQQTMLLTITLPSFLGCGVVLLGLCYFLRARGWCCRLFLDKSDIVVVDATEQNKTEETMQ